MFTFLEVGKPGSKPHEKTAGDQHNTGVHAKLTQPKSLILEILIE